MSVKRKQVVAAILERLASKNELDPVETKRAIQNLNRLQRAVQSQNRVEANRAINELCKLFLRNLG